MVISGTRLRTDGIKAISRGISGCNQNIKFANARNRGQLCLFFRNDDLINRKKKVSGICKVKLRRENGPN